MKNEWEIAKENAEKTIRQETISIFVYGGMMVVLGIAVFWFLFV